MSPAPRSTCSRPSRQSNSPLFGFEQCRLHAASGRRDRRSAGKRRAPGRRADQRLPAHRRGDERDQHAVGHGRGSAAPDALYGAVPELLGAFAGQLTQAREGMHAPGDHRIRRPRRRAEPSPAHGRGAGRPADAHDGGREHGQRAGGGAGTRHRRIGDGARPAQRISDPGTGDGGDGQADPLGCRERCSPARGHASWRSRASGSRRISPRTCST